MGTYVKTAPDELHLYGSARLGTKFLTAEEPGKLLLGLRKYELANHLGNVLAVLSDRKFITADIRAVSDYYPFGLEIAGRSWKSGDYRFGFNGKENDSDFGKGAIDFGARIYDSRIGRWQAVDPVFKPFLSPYQFARNSPGNYIDPDGNDEFHFHYFIRDEMDGEGKIHQVLYVSLEVIKNNEDHSFYVHNIRGKDTRFYPVKRDRNFILPNQGSFKAHNDKQPLAEPASSWLMPVFTDDYLFLGKLLIASGNEKLGEEYRDDPRKIAPILRGAVNIANTADFASETAKWADRVVLLSGGYAIAKGGYKLLLQQAAKKQALSGGAATAKGGLEKLSLNVPKNIGAVKGAFSVNPNKFNYFFGRVVSGSAHNIARSVQNLKDLTTLGIKSESQLMKVFGQALESGTTVSTKTSQYGTTVMRSVNIGNKGSINVGFFYQSGNMSTKPSVSTIIPKIFK